MKHPIELQAKQGLPNLRQETISVCNDLPPHKNITVPEIRTTFIGNGTKIDGPGTILTVPLRTIDTYPDNWIDA